MCNDLSKWRDFRIRIAPTRPVGRPPKHLALNTFYGYPAEPIAEWCCIDQSATFACESRRVNIVTAWNTGQM